MCAHNTPSRNKERAIALRTLATLGFMGVLVAVPSLDRSVECQFCLVVHGIRLQMVESGIPSSSQLLEEGMCVGGILGC